MSIRQSLSQAAQLKIAGDGAGAEKIFRDALAQGPTDADSLNQLGLFAHFLRDYALAEQLFSRAIAADPTVADYHVNHATVLGALGRYEECIAVSRRSLQIRQDLPQAHHNLGTALLHLRCYDEAADALKQSIALRPDNVQTLHNLGRALQKFGRLDEAAACFRRALSLQPAHRESLIDLGNVFFSEARLNEALGCYAKAASHSNRLYCLWFHPAYDAQTILREHQEWNKIYAEPLRPASSSYPNDLDAERRLRIGYVSPDFRGHVVGINMLPLLSHHDHQRVEVFCYSSVGSPDRMTARLRALADTWVDIARLDDTHAVDLIRGDRIDILIDLTQHMAGNRVLLFARKPAPVQVSYLGYVGTTGLETMDYRLSDPQIDPPGEPTEFYTEKTIRLPRTYWCYQPPDPAAVPVPPVVPPPALGNGYVTFGCLNNFAKVSSKTLDAWAQILIAVPNSRLLIHAPFGDYLQSVIARFPPGRLQLVRTQEFAGYLQTYRLLDIALDPFPYGGGITTCDALWMGVPVVTLRGKTAVGRGGSSILANVGFPDWIASNTDDYVRIATDLARNIHQLNELRFSLRQRMLNSPLMNAPQFARDVEAAFRLMWSNYCQSNAKDLPTNID